MKSSFSIPWIPGISENIEFNSTIQRDTTLLILAPKHSFYDELTSYLPGKSSPPPPPLLPDIS